MMTVAKENERERGLFRVYSRGLGERERDPSPLLFLQNIARDNLNDCPPLEFPLTDRPRGGRGEE